MTAALPLNEASQPLPEDACLPRHLYPQSLQNQASQMLVWTKHSLEQVDQYHQFYLFKLINLHLFQTWDCWSYW